MAEDLSPSHIPDEKHAKAYEDWADGGWGMVLTGEEIRRKQIYNRRDLYLYFTQETSR